MQRLKYYATIEIQVFLIIKILNIIKVYLKVSWFMANVLEDRISALVQSLYNLVSSKISLKSTFALVDW